MTMKWMSFRLKLRWSRGRVWLDWTPQTGFAIDRSPEPIYRQLCRGRTRSNLIDKSDVSEAGAIVAYTKNQG
jgi:hypothetical protein